MSNWKKGYLADLIKSLEQGVSVNSIDDNNINENTPLILKTSCVSAGFFDPTESKKIHPKDLGKQKLNPIANSILISRMNTPALVGASAYVNKTYKNIFLPDRLWMAVKKHDEVCMEWLSQIISSDYYWSKIRDRATGTSPSMKNISKKDLLKLPILIPSHAEQLEISKALKTWDTAIEKTEALIDAKERQFGWLQKRALDDDFKSYDSHLCDYAVIMKQQKIEEVGELKPLTVKLHCKGIEANERDMQITLSKKGRPYFQRFADEFLIGRQNFHNGGFGIVPERLDGFIASSAITTLEIDTAKLDPKYLFYFFSRKDYYLRIGHIMDGTGQKELSDKQIMKLPVSIPSIEKQKEVVVLLDTAQQEINLLKKLADQYRTQKRGLMQKLLSGEWYIKNKEAA